MLTKKRTTKHRVGQRRTADRKHDRRRGGIPKTKTYLYCGKEGRKGRGTATNRTNRRRWSRLAAQLRERGREDFPMLVYRCLSIDVDGNCPIGRHLIFGGWRLVVGLFVRFAHAFLLF